MIVMDANAALAVAMGLDVGDALALLREEDEEVVAPSLLTAEVCHALTKYVRGGYMDAKEAIACGRDAIMLVDRFVDDASLWIEAATESIRLEHSSYDMFYLLLARRECATLFTLDRKLQQLCADIPVDCVHTIGV